MVREARLGRHRTPPTCSREPWLAGEIRIIGATTPAVQGVSPKMKRWLAASGWSEIDEPTISETRQTSLSVSGRGSRRTIR